MTRRALPILALLFLTGAVQSGGQAPSAPGLVLAPMRQRVSAQVARLANAGGIRVPASDAERFLRDYYPALSHVIPVTSSDGSVVLPEVAPPSLSLVVTHTPGHHVGLEWFVDYRIGDAVRRFPWGEPAPSGGLRDVRAEADLAMSVPLAADRWANLREPTDRKSTRLNSSHL